MFHRYKHVVKNIAEKHNARALLLSKPYPKESGCSSHFNHSLWDLSKKTNAFSDTSKDDKLSEVCKNWIGGLQEHSKALTALQCITMNCFERCKPGTFAPTNNSWGFDNRTVGFRVKNGSPSSTYIENRIPGAGSNPYLVTAGCLIAGMDGIKRNLQPKSKPFKGNLYEVKELPEGVENLPSSLKEALKCLKEDEVFVKEFGEYFMRAYTVIKTAEIEKWKTLDEIEKWDYYRKELGKYF